MENGPNEVSEKKHHFWWFAMDFHGFWWFSPRRLVWAGADDIKSIQKIDPKNIFQPTFFFDQNGFEFFRRKKLSMKKIWLPIPMRNFPKIPKITLRTACEHFKKQLEQKVTVYVLLDRHGNSLQIAQRIWRGGSEWAQLAVTLTFVKIKIKVFEKYFLDFWFFSPKSLGYVLATFRASGTPSIDL